MLKRIDYAHLIAMVVFLGGLEYVLEEGPRNEWLDDAGIAVSAWLAVVAFALFLERSLRSAAPIVRLSPFRQPTFIFACVFNLVIGFGMYSSIYLIPVFLGRVRDYTSLDIGTTVFITGVAQLGGTIVAARLSQVVDIRNDDHRRPRALCSEPVADVVHHAGVGIRRVRLPAGAARVRDHVVYRARA